MNKSIRENNFDLLRLLACIGVIFIHASSEFKSALTNGGLYLGTSLFDTKAILLYNTLPRFAVPCFFMLSGAFILSDQRNIDYKSFYKKIFKKIVKPVLFFYAFYFLAIEVNDLLNVIKGIASKEVLLSNLMNLICGIPSPHLWTMTVMVCIYYLIPFVLKFKEMIGEDKFFIFSIIYFVVSCFSGNTSYNVLYWSIGTVLCYLGYFLAGYQIKRLVTKKSLIKSLISFALAIIFLILVYRLQCVHTLMGISEYEEEFQIIDSFSPYIVLSSVCIFYGFANIDVNINIHTLSKYTFLIYLIHAIVVKGLYMILNFLNINMSIIYLIPLVAMISLVISLIISIPIDKIINRN